ncbi:MAG TPA: transposase, partial [Chlorobaculum parvum]|nr:transposase [Chlorobaculum parvum]
MKNINPLGLFDEQFLLERLTKLKDPLVKLEAHIDWQLFAPILEVAFTKPSNRKSMGRPPFDRLMMFKLLILQSLYNLSDDQTEYQMTDRLSFKRFLGLKSSDKVPDSKTIWKFRETLIQEEVIEALFFRFNQALD